MGAGSSVLFLVILITLFINYKNNRCPKCKKWEFKGFSRVDEEIISDDIKVYCSKCHHTWTIKYKKSELQPKTDTTSKD